MVELKFLEKLASAIVGEPCIIVTKREWEEPKARIAILEAKLADKEELLTNNSQNSSKPPSTDFPDAEKPEKKRKEKKKGPKKGHEASFRELIPESEVDETKEFYPEAICGCGGEVEPSLGKPERKQFFELPEIKPVVTEVHLNFGKCQKCGKLHKAELPEEYSNGILEPVAMGWIGMLSGKFHLSKRKIKAIFQDLLNLPICLGTISKTEERLSQALKKPYEEALAHIKTEPVVYMDETGHKEKKKKGWVWLCASKNLAVFVIAFSRGTEIAKSILTESFKGILESDRWGAYSFIETIRRQLCWAHLKRDFTKISERIGVSAEIGLKLLKYIRRMFKLWKDFKQGKISRIMLQKQMKPVREGILSLLGTGASCGHKKTEASCKRLLKLREALFTFVDIEGVDPTNNHAERLIRTYVIWRKNSFFTQSERGNRFIERILTVCASCSLQKQSPLDFITNSIKAYNSGLTYPSLIPAKIQHDMTIAVGF